MHYFIYGPPCSGKSTLGRALADKLELPFIDIDDVIVQKAGKSISDIFSENGEAFFRTLELETVETVLDSEPSVIALGGGALLNPQTRQMVEKRGLVLCLDADQDILIERMHAEAGIRPLLAGDPVERMKVLLSSREMHYASFQNRLDTGKTALDELVWNTQFILGAFRVHGMGPAYDVRIQEGALAQLGREMRARQLQGPVALVTDQNVGAIYREETLKTLREAGYTAAAYSIAPGEEHKTIDTVLEVWDFFIRSGIERSSTIVALGGGVVGDLTGFAASTFLRGVAWVNVPTSLLAMVDSSLGGKTGIDLKQAKNLVGAFYPPKLVLADPSVLTTLPIRELSNGMAEVVKHGIIGDEDLFACCELGLAEVEKSMDRIVRQAMAVKLKVIEADPYEKGLRQALNLGHTIGHGVELVSSFSLSHGEAVAIGTVAEAIMAEKLGIAAEDLAKRIAGTFSRLGLPVTIPSGLSLERMVAAIQLDKKKAGGKVRFALPVRVGEVRTGVLVEEWQKILEDFLDQGIGGK